ncbi:MAG: adenylate/guanylate cyclase domain-containing protein [Sphingomonadaceae bacterium]|nr:adenylate/guanylate cyclase domain-containing protein [Sphingomonadaceae bacterium]
MSTTPAARPLVPRIVQPITGRARALKRIGPERVLTTALALVVGLLLARFSWDTPILRQAEAGLYDLRTALAAPRVDQDQRITMVVFTEGTLQRSKRRSPLDRKLLATALQGIDRAGAKAIGVDILIDSPMPDEDGGLIAALKGLRTPTYFAFAGTEDTSAFILPWQEEHLRGFFKAVEPAVRPASVRLEADGDGVIRRWPASSPYARPIAQLITATTHDGRTAVRFRQPLFKDRPVFNKVGVELLATPGVGAALAPLFKDKIVLVGADLPTEDRLPTPDYALTGQSTAGTEILAHMAAQALDGAWPARIPPWALWLCALAAVAAGAYTSVQEQRSWWLRIALVLQLAALLAGPFLLAAAERIDTYSFPALGWVIGWLLAFVMVGSAARSVSAEQRRFAQGALGQYLPKDVAAQILREPERLALRGEDREIYALFTDLEGFTKRSHRLTPAEVGNYMNAYLDQLCEIALRYGATIDKFIGDAVVAFWGAPVARPDDAKNALAAAVEMCRPMRLSVDLADGSPDIGRTRVGLHFGPVVVGNFGGSGRFQYTALGDAMNTAARLEAANKSLKTKALISREVKDRVPPGGPGLRPMGRIVLRGRETPIEVYEPCENAADGQLLDRLYRRFDDGDRSAIEELKLIAAASPNDIALDFFVFRLRQIGPGGAFALE